MGFLDRIFKKRVKRDSVAIVRENSGGFTSWNADAYSSDIFRAAVHSIAANAAKLHGVHVINHDNHREVLADCKLTRLLSERPNAAMSAYDWLYKTVTQLYTKNNSFSLLDRDDFGNVQGVYPIDYSNAEFLTDTDNNLYTKFVLYNGNTVTFKYTDIIHLRRNFADSQFFGSDNSHLVPALELAHAANTSIVKGLQSSAGLRGMLKYQQILPDDVKKEQRDSFIEEFLSLKNDGGIVVLDSKADYIPIENKPLIISSEQQTAIREKIYAALNISADIVNSSYDENTWGAFYESVIEPIAIQLSEEFTTKVFSERQRVFGNKIVFESGRLAYMNNQSRINMLKELVPLGLLSVNDALTILNLPSVPDGDRRLQSLNYINAGVADAYQLAKVNSSIPDKDKNTENEKE